MSPRNLFVSASEQLAASWEQEADQRMSRTPSDPAAETLKSCASELRMRLKEVERDSAYLNVHEFARHRGLHESTVRRLCVRGELEGAEKDATNEWRIPRDAKRVIRRGSRQLKAAS
jgi:hypothetical protein